MTTTVTPASPPPPSPARRFAAWLHRHRGVRLVVILALPLVWLGLIYLGSLFILFLNAFW